MEHFYENIQGWFDFQRVYEATVKNFPSGSHFVEVGSWKGKSSCFLAVEIINSNKDIKLDCVDTWCGTLGEHEKEESVLNETLFDEFLDNIEPVKGVITPIRKSSIEAAQLYEDESLEFVFIDANHEYEEVLKDMKAWYPKLKYGGIIAGHDFMCCENKSGVEDNGVAKAVKEFLFGENINTIHLFGTSFVAVKEWCQPTKV